MAKRKKGKKKSELWLGIGAVAAGLAALVLICLSFALPGEIQPPETTGAPTLPPPADNVYGPEDFVMAGDYLTCIAGESILGIDVSAHQQTVDWEQVSAAGIKFAMIRLAYRGYESGQLMADEFALQNLAGAKAAGLQVGAYVFSQAVSVEEAREEAAFALEILDGRELDFPLVFDWEYVSETARTGSADRRTVTDCALAFCQAAEDAGYTPMVYFNPHLAETGLLLEELTQYDFWLAMYDAPMTFPYRVQMWQYTQTGTVPGIEGNVDINLYLP